MGYYRAVCSFLAWVEQHQVGELPTLSPFTSQRQPAAKPTVKHHRAAIRKLFEWLIIGQVIAGPSTSCAVARRRCSPRNRPAA
jgi:hypothetical protein